LAHLGYHLTKIITQRIRKNDKPQCSESQKTIERITQQLPHVPDEVLESLLTLLEHVQPMDAWEKKIADDSLSGKFDELVQEVLSEHQAGRTTNLIEGLSGRAKR
jgi:hypothetical protein